MTNRMLWLVGILAGVGVARPALAQMLTPEARAIRDDEGDPNDPRAFGRSGQLTVGGTIGFGGFGGSAQGAVFRLSSDGPEGGTSTSTTVLGLEGQIGYLVVRNLEVGIGLLAGQSTTTSTPPATAMMPATVVSSLGFAILPYVRYHIPIRSTVFFYVGGAVGYHSEQATATTGATSTASGISGPRFGVLGGIEMATGHLILAFGPELVYWLATESSGGTRARPNLDINVTGRIGAYF